MSSNVEEMIHISLQNVSSESVSEDVIGESQYVDDLLHGLPDLDNMDSCVNDYFGQDFIDSFESSAAELLLENQLVDILRPVESNDAIYRVQSPDDQLEIAENNSSRLPVTRSASEKNSNSETSEPDIALSNSVLVTTAPPNQLHLVHPLEEIYRARYKSDYFPQKGAARRPRYVADNTGNHHVTIQIPQDHQNDLKEKFLRIALITTNIPDRGHFYSPYKFQTDNDNINVPDQNPILVPVKTSAAEKFQMKLHLVLIKSKLDQLRSVQPLKPFPYPSNAIQNSMSNEILTPKELVNRYQLDKSHVAFTLCKKLPNQSYQIYEETTVLSSIITEANVQPPTKTTSPSDGRLITSKSSSSSNFIRSDGKQLCCPNCSHVFSINETQSASTTMKKRKSSEQNTNETVENSAVIPKAKGKRRKKIEE